MNPPAKRLKVAVSRSGHERTIFPLIKLYRNEFIRLFERPHGIAGINKRLIQIASENHSAPPFSGLINPQHEYVKSG